MPRERVRGGVWVEFPGPCVWGFWNSALGTWVIRGLSLPVFPASRALPPPPSPSSSFQHGVAFSSLGELTQTKRNSHGQIEDKRAQVLLRRLLGLLWLVLERRFDVTEREPEINRAHVFTRQQ